MRAIYRHAGISQRALPAFAGFIGDLRNQYGFDYTNWQYRQLLDKLTSRFARDFLSTDAGYDFTRSATRILEDLEKGRISVRELEFLPGFPKGFWTGLRSPSRQMVAPFLTPGKLPSGALLGSSRRLPVGSRNRVVWPGFREGVSSILPGSLRGNL